METETVKTVKHTPLPWSYKRTHQLSSDTWYVLIDPNARGPIIDVGGKDVHGQIAEAKYLVTDPEEIEANAEFIVRACNSHYELLKCLTMIDECLSDGIPVEKNDPIHKKIKDLLTK